MFQRDRELANKWASEKLLKLILINWLNACYLF